MRFNKYKFTNNLFFKNIQFANVDVNQDEINILIPFLAYAGRFYIHSVTESVGYIHYRTARSVDGISKEDLLLGIDLNSQNEFLVDISKSKNRLKLYQRSLKGIILKK